MAEYNKEKYYWLKLKRDFFKRHDIQIIESLPNGKDYVLFYLKLMVESIDHDGALRFSDTIPYNEQMLSVVTNTNIDIVRSAIKMLNELGMVEVLDDQTLYLKEVKALIGSQTAGAEKKQLQLQRRLENSKGGQGVEKIPPKIEKELDIEIKKEMNKEKKLLEQADKPPSVAQKHKYGKYNNVLLTEDEHAKLLAEERGKEAIEYFSDYRERKGYKAKSDYLSIKKWVFTALDEETIREKRIGAAQPFKERTYSEAECESVVTKISDLKGIEW